MDIVPVEYQIHAQAAISFWSGLGNVGGLFSFHNSTAASFSSAINATSVLIYFASAIGIVILTTCISICMYASVSTHPFTIRMSTFLFVIYYIYRLSTRTSSRYSSLSTSASTFNKRMLGTNRICTKTLSYSMSHSFFLIVSIRVISIDRIKSYLNGIIITY
jgi:hypothetical protein